MKTKTYFAILATLALSACASAPAHLVAAKADVDSKLEYVHYKGWVKPAGLKPNQGNCVVFAEAYMLKVQGGEETLCQVPGGEWHAVLDVDGWRLDNREAKVLPIWMSNCTNNKKAF